MPSGIPINGINTGRFKKGERRSPSTEFKKGQSPIAPFKKGFIPWNKKEKIIKKCLICGEEFGVIPSRKDRAKYCSKLCLNMANRNYKHTETAILKIKKACTGCKISEKTRLKMRKASTRRWQVPEYWSQFSKENHFNWKGGISFEPYSINWTQTLKRSIRERDGYACQLCGKLQGDEAFSVHHIDYDKKNCDPKNLVTLCRGCHTKTNYNREYWIDYFR